MSILDAILTGPFVCAESTKRVASQYMGRGLTADEQQRLLCFAIETAERPDPCDTCTELRAAYDRIEDADTVLDNLSEALVVDYPVSETVSLLLQKVRGVLLTIKDTGLRDRLMAKAGLTMDWHCEHDPDEDSCACKHCGASHGNCFACNEYDWYDENGICQKCNGVPDSKTLEQQQEQQDLPTDIGDFRIGCCAGCGRSVTSGSKEFVEKQKSVAGHPVTVHYPEEPIDKSFGCVCLKDHLGRDTVGFS